MKNLLKRLKLVSSFDHELVGIVSPTSSLDKEVSVLGKEHVKHVFGIPTKYVCDESFDEALKLGSTEKINLDGAKKKDLVYRDIKSGKYVTA
jgi:hypothetical protein